MIRPEDDSFHDAGDDPYWNESAYFTFVIPERKLDGLVYFWHRPNMNLSSAIVALWDPSGEQTYDSLFYEFSPINELPKGSDMFRFTLDNGLTAECLEPLRSYRLGFEGDGLGLDLRWDGFMEPWQWSPASHNGYGSFAHGHYQQGGRLAGSVVLNGETFPVDCLGIRDRSWGPRRLHASPWVRGGFEWGHASETSSFLVASTSRLPVDEDPIVGTTESVLFGWYIRDGVLGNLTSGQRRVERGDGGRPLRFSIEAQDDLDRELRVDGSFENVLRWHGPWFCFWSLTRCRFDGQDVWGDSQDTFIRPRQSPHLRSLLRHATSPSGGRSSWS
jgi:hypothetical protein